MIGVCGYGLTGSDAVLNLLKEYDNLNIVADREFILTYFPGGIEDLEFHLMEQTAKFFSSDIAIKNFLKFTKSICHNEKSYYYRLTDGHFNEYVNEYIASLVQTKWEGRWMYDDYIFDSFTKKLIYAIEKRIRPLNSNTYRIINCSIKPENFYEETRKFLKKVYNNKNKEGIIVVDQPFPANNLTKSMNLFGDDSKAIVLVRDPRDVYIQGKLRKYDWMQWSNAHDFIAFYKRMYSTITESNEKVLYIYLEDMIYKYSESVKKVEDFVGIDSEYHIRKKEVFSPEGSMKNTKLFEKYKEYEDDIKIIEKEMTEYLYDYSKI